MTIKCENRSCGNPFNVTTSGDVFHSASFRYKKNVKKRPWDTSTT